MFTASESHLYNNTKLACIKHDYRNDQSLCVCVCVFQYNAARHDEIITSYLFSNKCDQSKDLVSNQMYTAAFAMINCTDILRYFEHKNSI